LKQDYIILFTRNGLGDAPAELQQKLVTRFLALLIESNQIPSKIVFYTEGVKLACDGSPVLELLGSLEAQGVELVLCQTCLDFFNLADQVKIGVVGGMGDILEVLQKAPKVLSV
jgi:sulfur relay (sulfurtransferase) complex TusBCD TusD component (DsrE family)